MPHRKDFLWSSVVHRGGTSLFLRLPNTSCGRCEGLTPSSESHAPHLQCYCPCGSVNLLVYQSPLPSVCSLVSPTALQHRGWYQPLQTHKTPRASSGRYLKTSVAKKKKQGLGSSCEGLLCFNEVLFIISVDIEVPVTIHCLHTVPMDGIKGQQCPNPSHVHNQEVGIQLITCIGDYKYRYKNA